MTRRRTRWVNTERDFPDEYAYWKAREIYCSWGHHKVLPMSHVVEKFEQGTMCLECQIKVAHSLLTYIGMPDMSAGLHAFETRRAATAKTEKQTVARVRGESAYMGFVYYIRINGQIKIGYAADVKQRMRNYPPGSELLAVEPGTLNTERERHQDFARYLERGREWFHESDALRTHIAKVREECGDPSALAYQYTQKKVA